VAEFVVTIKICLPVIKTKRFLLHNDVGSWLIPIEVWPIDSLQREVQNIPRCLRVSVADLMSSARQGMRTIHAVPRVLLLSQVCRQGPQFQLLQIDAPANKLVPATLLCGRCRHFEITNTMVIATSY